ncbi:hypothetical protein [Pseudoxanthomonas sp. PXM01]|uniref:hypothetical protein n=1 Tax=Pseudoxanthomonas sp. PXM01 TaxID=2769295 RepID=UPI00177C3F73|nr:hypothetical protein [Pseudoxanthomonas sp. PXM01]MBD9470896.1 hypothetical protein [Pseudoxanthomonas sp. PXM01]
MWPHTRSFAIGALGSVVALALSVWALGWSGAITRPKDVGMAVWEWAVVLGLGATLVALAVHSLLLAVSRAARWPAFAGFATSLAVILLVSGSLAATWKTLVMWCLGALLASWWVGRTASRDAPGRTA